MILVKQALIGYGRVRARRPRIESHALNACMDVVGCSGQIGCTSGECHRGRERELAIVLGVDASL